MRSLWICALLLCSCQAGIAPNSTPRPSSQEAPATSTLVQPTPTLSLTEAIRPYTIAGLREHDFRSGPIEVRGILEITDIFTRYLIAYPSDDLVITGILQIPRRGTPPFPVLVLNHGYFYRGDFNSGDGTDRAAEYFNRRGYLTLSSDYRSWGGSGVGASLFYSGLVIDVINLLNGIASIPEADPDRIGMLGHSMGGGITVKVLAVDRRVRAAVLYSTVSADDADIIERWGSGCIGDVFENELLVGCNSSDIVPLDLPSEVVDAYQKASYEPALLRETSAIFHLEGITAPVQIGYGTEDGQVLSGTPPAWSQKLHAALLEAGVSSELFAYEGEGHSFLAEQWVAFMERSARFFDKHVRSES